MPDGKSKKSPLRECSNALIERQHNGACTPAHQEKFLVGRDVFTRIIIEILAMPRGENNSTKLRVREAMKRCNRGTDYYFTDTVVREIADVCLTLRILGERPKEERDAIPYEKVVEATILCQMMQEELPR